MSDAHGRQDNCKKRKIPPNINLRQYFFLISVSCSVDTRLINRPTSILETRNWPYISCDDDVGRPTAFNCFMRHTCVRDEFTIKYSTH